MQTLHNFRITCANGLLMRAGRPCELCVDGTSLHAVAHRCYRDSFVGSTALSHMIARHKRERTWQRHVDRFIVLSRFARDVFVRAGVPAEQIVVKPNVVDDPAPVSGTPRAGVLYVGRLREEKGIEALAAAAHLTDAAITVVGDGPCSQAEIVGARQSGPARRAAARGCARDDGPRGRDRRPVDLLRELPDRRGRGLCSGTPVIASRIGALAEIVEDGRTGWLVAPGDPADLAAAIDVAAMNAAEAGRRGAAARRAYLTHYTPRASLQTLEAVYADALAERHSAPGQAASSRLATEIFHVA